MAETLDMETLRQWIGRTETARDLVTPQKARELRATLDLEPGQPQIGDETPLTTHWCLAPPTAALHAIGSDGHPARGGFLPPVPLPRRMWAGGGLEFHHSVRVGDEVTRVSRIRDVTAKEGRTGLLCFATVDHEISTPRGVAIRERQDIVYRGVDAPAGGQGKAEPSRVATWQESVQPGPVMLFRYSAVTFNSHRIHYDRDYCLTQEGYPGLVVHGPLQATLLVELAARLLKRAPVTFSFRSVRPVFDGAPMTLNACEGATGLDLWTADTQGRAAMLAQAT